jgi:hypothetical protein
VRLLSLCPDTGGDDRALYPVPGTAEVTSVERVDGHETAGSSGLHFPGYLIEIALEHA